MLEVTESAEAFIAGVVARQDADDLVIQIDVSDGGTPRARVDMRFADSGELDAEYVPIPTRNPVVRLYTRQSNDQWLSDGLMDFKDNDSGGTITVDAPNLQMPTLGDDATLEERINYVLAAEVNPGLAAHGGMVTLVELTEDNTAVLQFGGGCQGCGMVDMTLAHGVEQTLMNAIPDLVAVRDVTDHTDRENAYYR